MLFALILSSFPPSPPPFPSGQLSRLGFMGFVETLLHVVSCPVPSPRPPPFFFGALYVATRNAALGFYGVGDEGRREDVEGGKKPAGEEEGGGL